MSIKDRLTNESKIGEEFAKLVNTAKEAKEKYIKEGGDLNTPTKKLENLSPVLQAAKAVEEFAEQNKQIRGIKVENKERDPLGDHSWVSAATYIIPDTKQVVRITENTPPLPDNSIRAERNLAAFNNDSVRAENVILPRNVQVYNLNDPVDIRKFERDATQEEKDLVQSAFAKEEKQPTNADLAL